MFKDNLLKNKTIVVTGGGSGLASMARRFGELGANLVISEEEKEVLEEAATSFQKKNRCANLPW